MTGRTAARLVAASVLGLSVAGTANAARIGGHGGGGHAGGFAGFHGGARVAPFAGGPRFFHGPHFGTRVFIGGAVFAPFFYPYPYYDYPPAYYPPAYYPQPYYPPATGYVEPQPAPAAASWYYCPSSRAYYPYVRECPEGWQRVSPQPPS